MDLGVLQKWIIKQKRGLTILFLANNGRFSSVGMVRRVKAKFEYGLVLYENFDENDEIKIIL